MNIVWTKPTGQSLPNLHVISVDGVEMGFITKPRDTKYDKNMWRVFRGIGDKATFLCHVSTKAQAMQCLESIYGRLTKSDQICPWSIPAK